MTTSHAPTVQSPTRGAIINGREVGPDAVRWFVEMRSFALEQQAHGRGELTSQEFNAYEEQVVEMILAAIAHARAEGLEQGLAQGAAHTNTRIGPAPLTPAEIS